MAFVYRLSESIKPLWLFALELSQGSENMRPLHAQTCSDRCLLRIIKCVILGRPTGNVWYYYCIRWSMIYLIKQITSGIALMYYFFFLAGQHINSQLFFTRGKLQVFSFFVWSSQGFYITVLFIYLCEAIGFEIGKIMNIISLLISERDHQQVFQILCLQHYNCYTATTYHLEYPDSQSICFHVYSYET